MPQLTKGPFTIPRPSGDLLSLISIFSTMITTRKEDNTNNPNDDDDNDVDD